MGLQGQQRMQLISLKKKYNQALKRYYKMVEWCETATINEQANHYNLIVEVINNCNNLLNEIKEIDKLVAPQEIVNGFKIF